MGVFAGPWLILASRDTILAGSDRRDRLRPFLATSGVAAPQAVAVPVSILIITMVLLALIQKLVRPGSKIK